MKKNKNYNVFVWGIILSLICIIPYLTKSSNLYESDIVYHLSRIEGLSNSILETGNFFPKIYNSLFYEQGYAFPMFYCDIFLIIPAVFHIVGVSLITSYKLFIFLCNLLTFFSFYSLLKKFKLSENWCCFLSVIYLFSYYRLYDIYYRASLGEILSFIFIPLVLKGIYEIIFENNEFLINNSIVVGFSGLALSHNISLFLSSFLFAIFLIVNISKITKSKLKKIVFNTIIVLMISSWFLFPMIEQMFALDLIANYETVSFANQFFNLKDMMYIFGNSTFFDERIGDLIIIASIALFIVDYKRIKKTFIFQTYLIGFSFFILTYNGFQFISPIFKVIQFPSRFYLISTLLLSFSCSISMYNLFANNKWVENTIEYIKYCLLTIGFCFVIIYLLLDSPLVVAGIQSKGYFDDNKTEYLEILNSDMARDRCFNNKFCLNTGIDDLYLTKDFIIRKPNNFFDLVSRKGGNYLFELNIDLEKGKYNFPIVYYKGYVADCYDNKCELVPDGGQVAIQLSNDMKKGEQINIIYKETLLTKICKILSLISVVIYLCYFMKYKKYSIIFKR